MQVYTTLDPGPGYPALHWLVRRYRSKMIEIAHNTKTVGAVGYTKPSL